MQLEKYYEFLEPNTDEKLLVIGKDAILIALYIGGRAKSKNIHFKARAIVPKSSELNNEISAIMYANDNLSEQEAQSVRDGVSYVSFLVDDLSDPLVPIQEFDKVIIQSSKLTIKHIEKLTQRALKDSVFLFELPVGYFRPLKGEEKGIFRKEQTLTTFKKLLETIGFKIEYYDIQGQGLDKKAVVKANFPGIEGRKTEAIELKFLELEEFSEHIKEEILEYIKRTKPDSEYGVLSDNKEYIYFVSVESRENEPITLHFIFLDGEITHREVKTLEHSKHFDIIVLPNTNTFEQEIGSKDKLIVMKHRLWELYGEKA